MLFMLFHKQYFVAINLFADLERAREAYVEHKMSWHGVYAISLLSGSVARLLGWVNVCTNNSAPSFWNEQMRSKGHFAARWRHGGPTFEPQIQWDQRDPWQDKPIDRDSLDDVQLTTVYPVRERTEKRAAKAAWAQFLAGDQTHTEWYDASADQRWTKLFCSPTTG
jgi:hypothetical protein